MQKELVSALPSLVFLFPLHVLLMSALLRTVFSPGIQITAIPSKLKSKCGSSHTMCFKMCTEHNLLCIRGSCLGF